MKRLHIFIEGKVQGVFYRATMQRVARTLQLNGWIRNLPNGQVEALFEGDDKRLDEIINWSWIGPPQASVKSVTWTEEAYQGEYSDCSIRY